MIPIWWAVALFAFVIGTVVGVGLYHQLRAVAGSVVREETTHRRERER